MTDHYEMPHARADECPHAGVGKACRPCRDRFERAPITPDERAAAHADDATCASCTHEYVADMEKRAEDAEAKAERQRDRLRAREEQVRRLRAEVTRLHALVTDLRATVSPVWDEDTVTEAVARRLHTDACSEYDYAWEPNAGTFRDQARGLLAVVREHLP